MIASTQSESCIGISGRKSVSKTSIAIIGCGNMGGSIARALCRKDCFDVSVYDADTQKAASFALENGASALASIVDAKGKDIVLIAVKPQIMPSIFPALASLEPGFFISIAAGISLDRLKKNLNGTCVRFMPNLAARTNKAVTAVCFAEDTDDCVKEMAIKVAESFGSAFEIDESLLAAFIGISGSAIAYAFEIFHHIAMGGVREGIPYPKALSIVRDTFESATSLLKESGLGAVELETMVCSAGGTTIEGIKALQDGALGATLINAVAKAADKSRTMEAKGDK